MAVVVAYASKYGWTEGIAERIAQRLREEGLDAAARPVAEVKDLAACEALVIGSGVYLGRWLKEAKEFLRLNQAALAERPVWMFSSGPVGNRTPEDKGSEPAPGPLLASEKAALEKTLEPRDHRVFYGGFSRRGLGFCDRLVAIMPASKAVLPEGDFRDWEAIEAWAASIAAELAESASPGRPAPTGGLVKTEGRIPVGHQQNHVRLDAKSPSAHPNDVIE